MFVTIASLQQPTFHSEFSWSRKPGQSIVSYVTQELDRRVQFVSDRLNLSAELTINDYVDSQCLFFTLPEFFWNVPWASADTEEELLQLSSCYLEQLPGSIAELIKWLPLNDYGKVVLVAGTCASLIKVEDSQGECFEVVNSVLLASNFKFLDDGFPELSMWPKRHVSGIDFGSHVGSDETYWYFQLSDNLKVKVRKLSSALSEHNTAQGYGPVFFNSMIEQCPFSINVCLDYAQLEESERDEELEQVEAKIDFLIACGMSFDQNRQYPPSVQFALRNDGMGKGRCQFAKVSDGRISHEVDAVKVEDTLHVVQLELS